MIDSVTSVRTGRHSLRSTNEQATVVFYLEAESIKDRHILPEIEATGNLKVSAGRSYILLVSIKTFIIIVNEEEGVAPVITVETFQGSSSVSTILGEIVEHLEIGLRLGNLAKCKSCYSNCKNSFFRHK